ncbi:uncharacterized protein LOC109594350 [Aethina tumida]|uniref:uncharacterized protein LOC109594350 n=1 Tax=Aethina tumida TaxID=116153 RepID=UPI00096B168C|nr:uncharacterized protein LOC109594350 [Aethina tumida]
MTSTADLVTDSVADLTEKNGPVKKTFGEMSLRERIDYTREVITIEPIIAAYVMASYLCGPALYNLEFEKSCRVNLAYNDTVCEAILSGYHQNYTGQNEQIQILIGDMHSWQSPLQTIMPLILVLFLGSFSDRHKWRKPFLVIPLIGELFAVVGVILCVVFMRSWPLEAQGILQTVVPSFFGGQTMVVMACFAYIADVSTVEMRTLRIGIVQIVLNACSPFVQSFSGKLFEIIGYYGILLIAAALYGFGILYGLFCIKEPRTPLKTGGPGILVDIFNPRHAVDTFNLMLKKKPGNDRFRILLVLLIMFIYSGVNVGEFSVFYLYVQSVFNWTPVEFSYFVTINTLIHLFGTVAGVSLFAKVFKLNDLTILMLTFIDKIASNVVFGLASSVTMLYVAACVSVITGITAVGIRSLATKIVSENDLGKAQSLFGICEAVAPAIATPLYNKGIYLPTFELLPSAFFYFGAILFVLCCLVVLGIYFGEKRMQRKVNHEYPTFEKPIPMQDVQITHM